MLKADLDPRGWGWSALSVAAAPSLLERSAINQAKLELVAYVTVSRTRQQCLAHVKATLGTAKRTIDEALKHLEAKGLLRREKRGRETSYRPVA